MDNGKGGRGLTVVSNSIWTARTEPNLLSCLPPPEVKKPKFHLDASCAERQRLPSALSSSHGEGGRGAKGDIRNQASCPG